MNASALAPPSSPDGASVDATIASAVSHLKEGRRVQALAAVRTLESVAPLHPVACTILGLVTLSAGAPDMALAWLDRAIATNASDVDALKGRATVLAELGRHAEADAAFARAFEAGCVDPPAHYHHGNVLAAMGRRDAAVAAYDRALRLRPAYPEALRAGGVILRDSGNAAQALRFFDEALRLQPNYFDAILDRANLLEQENRQAEALATLDAGLGHFPGNAQLLNNRGIVLLHLGRLAESLDSLEAALAADSSLAQAHLNKGQVEVRKGHFEAALSSFEAALSLRAGYAEAWCARGVALKLLGRFVEARASFEAALHHDPGSVYARTNRGELALLLGDFEAGWPDYDFRFLTRDHDRPVLGWPVPEWRGETNPGRVVVFADQAAGDVIHFARYLPVLRAAGADVTFVCRPRMQRLLRKASEGMRVVGDLTAREAFDFQIPLSNMPLACRTMPETIPDAPYIAAESELVAALRERLGAHGFRIGLCWRGNQNWRADPKRSVPLGLLRALADVPGTRLISLQMADNLGPDLDSFAAMRIETLAPELDIGPDAFVETAALMANLDLVISCDTSIAHLAGALGRPTFVLLQAIPEWRFMLEREDSPWYPSMRLFRQKRRDEWGDPIDRLVEAVGESVEAIGAHG